jgi:hypothetical protein
MDNFNGRMIFDNSRRALKKAFADVPNLDTDLFKLTQSFIRLEQPMVAGQTLYTFPVLANQGATFNTEQRLNLQDSLVISSIGMFVSVPASATDSAFKLFSYPNFFFFAATAAPAQALYNGRLNISVNNNTILPAWDLWRHWCTTDVQQNAAVAAAVFQDKYDGTENGYYACEPNLVLVGSKNYQVTIQLPAGIATITANSRITLIFRGILAQNSTVVS